MKDKVFVDTNLLVYFIGEGRKKEIAGNILIKQTRFHIVISSQVIGEFVNVCIRKKLLKEKEIYSVADVFMDTLEFYEIKINTLRKTFRIRSDYHYSFWDSLIIASALEAGCSILYTEDMQHNQIIDGTLKIVNPFL